MIETEICVIGAGPAGSTISSKLAESGRGVIVLDSHQIPRAHVGESLSPAIIPLLDYLGVRDAVENSKFLRPTRSIVIWGNVNKEAVPQFDTPGFQVDRGVFDSILVEMARQKGAVIMSATRATRITRNDEGGWDVFLRANGCLETLRCDYVVDASGRSGVLPHRQRINLSVPTMAIYGYWQEPPILGTEIHIEAGSDRWYWGTSLPNGKFNATVFVNPRRLQESANGLTRLYRKLLSESALLRSCLRSELITEPKVCVATPSIAKEIVGAHWIKCGEAAFAIDPLSSQGVQLAISNALQAAAVVSTSTTCNAAGAVAARQFYRNRVRSSAIRNADLAQEIYREHSEFCLDEFWSARAQFQHRDIAPIRERHNDIFIFEGEEDELAEGNLEVRHVTYKSHSSRLDGQVQSEDILELSKAVYIGQSPAINGRRVTLSTAVILPGGTEPIAFIGNVPVGYILELLHFRPTAHNLLRKLQDCFGRGHGLQVFNWIVGSSLVELNVNPGKDVVEREAVN